MKKLQKNLCMIMCICLFTAVLAGSVLSAAGCHHSCQGDDCVICTEISTWRRNLAVSFVCKATGLCGQPMLAINGTFLSVDPVPATDTLLAMGVLLII